ncbi:MAG: hypothetical protein AAF696_00775 [Bacteroidota bacterium]
MNRKINKNFLIIGAMILATVLAFSMISIFSKNSSAVNPGVVNEENLKQEIIQLESNLLELELVFKEKDEQVDNFETLLDEKYVELDNMSKKVRTLEEYVNQLEREGKADKRTIRELRGRLADARTKVVEGFKKEIDILVFDLGKLTQKGDSLKRVAGKSQRDYDSLSNVLESTRNNCENGVASTSTSPPVITPENVANTRPTGLYAENFDIIFYNKKRKKIKNLNKLGIKSSIGAISFLFDLEASGDIAIGDKKLYLVLKHRQTGNIIARQNYGKSGVKFSADGQSLIATREHITKYSGRTSRVNFEYEAASTVEDAVGGNYDIIVYWERNPGDVTEIGRTARLIR